MTFQEKLEWITSPERFYPKDINPGNLRGNKPFIDSLILHVNILRESQFWPEEKILEMRRTRLLKLFSYLKISSMFWSDYFKKINLSKSRADLLEEFKLLPIVDRQALQSFGEDIYVVKPDLGILRTKYSGGTSSTPLKAVFTTRELIISTLPFRLRHPVFENISLRDLLERKFAILLGMPGDRSDLDPDFIHHIFSDITSVDLDNASVRKEIYEKLREAEPAVLFGYASLVLKLAEYVEEDRVTIPILAVRLSSEPISIEDEAFIKKIFQVPIINMFSGSLAGLIGFECPKNCGKFHLNSERIILEIVKGGGFISDINEEGEIVVTALDRTITPIIRRRIEDMGKLLSESCVCGRTLSLFEFHGRRGYEIILPSGRMVKIIHLRDTLTRLRIGRFSKQIQIIQDRLDSIHLLVVPKSSFKIAYETEIRLGLTNFFKDEKMNIEIEYVNEIPCMAGYKPRFFIPLGK